MRQILRLAAAFSLIALPALAGTQPSRGPAQSVQADAAAMCRAQCVTAMSSRPGGSAVDPVQACTLRCAAAATYVANQNRRGTAEATGRGRPARVTPVAMGAAAEAARASYGVIYGARAPSAAFGMIVGERDRLAAHREAERQCSAGGPGCRVLAEFTAACGATAQGIKRSQWALFITSDPNSYVVTSISAGSGATQQEAERQALAECRSRDPQANCRVMAAACGTRG